MYREPLATILAVEAVGPNLVVSLTVEGDMHAPLAPASLHPMAEPDTLVLELHKAVRRNGHQITFHSYGSRGDESYPPVGGTYIFRQWWSPEQLALAQDKARRWEKQKFVPFEAEEIYLEGGVRVLRPMGREEERQVSGEKERGWEHEHCALCWQRIFAYGADQAVGYLSGDKWLCETCYLRYIESGFGRELGDQT